MKKFLLLLFLLVPIITLAEDTNMTKAKSSILMEYSTGKVLYENNSHEALPPASMTKIMSLILIMEQIDKGNIKLSDEVLISENAASMGGSQIYLQAGTKYTVEDLLKGITIASGNDAVVALAEKTYGTVDNFVKKMNEKGESLGLLNTTFKNPHGLDEEGHVSSAYDMALMAKELISHELILKYTSIYEEYLNRSDGSKTWLVNTNKLIRFYEGVDGLKTGYTKEAKYCLTATAKKNNVRYITVLMGEESSDERNKDTVTLLNYGFNNFKVQNLVKKDTLIDSIEYGNSKKIRYLVYTKDDLNDVKSIDSELKDIDYEIEYDKLTLPIKKGTIIGRLKYIDDTDVLSVPLYLKEDVKKANFFDYLYRNFKIIFTGKF